MPILLRSHCPKCRKEYAHSPGWVETVCPDCWFTEELDPYVEATSSQGYYRDKNRRRMEDVRAYLTLAFLLAVIYLGMGCLLTMFQVFGLK